ncbi:unnamed protein product, partial [Didymodactylos carnosus]
METAAQLLIQNRTTPYLEYVLQGSILDGSTDLLKARLQGLCDNITGEVETFHDHETVYTMRIPSSSNVSFRVRYAIDDQLAPTHLRYVAQAELDKAHTVSVRQYHDCCVTREIHSFLPEMGFQFDYEFVAKGWIFRKGRIKIMVAKIFQCLERCRGGLENDMKNLSEILRPFTTSHFVEMSLIGAMHEDKLGEEMRSFAEQLKPMTHAPTGSIFTPLVKTSIDIASLRKPYKQSTEYFDLKDLVSTEPFAQFKDWFEQALQFTEEANAVCLATATKNGLPSCRYVLLKGFNESGFKFFTNYDSRKGKELIRIEGRTEKLSDIESEEYFNLRPPDSQISAVISDQSQPIPS